MKIGITTDLESLASWLAWSDRSSRLHLPKQFAKDAAQYWEVISPISRGKWLELAATLGGVKREKVTSLSAKAARAAQQAAANTERAAMAAKLWADRDALERAVE